jgi:Fe-S-cluster containining protein
MSDATSGTGEGGKDVFFPLNGLSIDAITINQDGELKVAFDLPVVQTTAQYEQQLQGVRTFDVYRDPELERLCRDLFRAIRERVKRADPARLAVSCGRCQSSDCCRSYNVLVTREDVARLRDGLGIAAEAFQEKYLRPAIDWCSDYPWQLACDEDARGDKCVFLKETPAGQMRCSVYGLRPKICRDFDEKACDDFVPISEVAVIPVDNR